MPFPLTTYTGIITLQSNSVIPIVSYLAFYIAVACFLALPTSCQALFPINDKDRSISLWIVQSTQLKSYYKILSHPHIISQTHKTNNTQMLDIRAQRIMHINVVVRLWQ